MSRTPALSLPSNQTHNNCGQSAWTSPALVYCEPLIHFTFIHHINLLFLEASLKNVDCIIICIPSGHYYRNSPHKDDGRVHVKRIYRNPTSILAVSESLMLGITASLNTSHSVLFYRNVHRNRYPKAKVCYFPRDETMWPGSTTFFGGSYSPRSQLRRTM